MAEIELEGDKRLQRRFSRWGAKLRDHGVYAGTSHKRIVVPKRFLNEDHLKELGFQPVLVAIPEAGQDQFASYRHPNNLFHIHSHGDRWTMHEDSHPAATMLMQQGVNPVSAIVQGLPHVLGEGAPGLANFLGGVLKGRESTADAVAQEAKGIKTAGLRRKAVGGVAFVIDRPKGFTKTWGDKSFTYPVDYGYFPGIDGEDGEGLDAFVGDTLDGHYECFQKLKPGAEGTPVLDETKFLVAVDDASREKIYELYGDEVHARQVLNGMNGVKGALKKFKKTKKERYVEKTAAAEQEPVDRDAALTAGALGIAGGGALAHRAAPLVTGRTRLYHGTTPEIAEKIKEHGLQSASMRPGKPGLTDVLPSDIRDQAKELVYLDRSPGSAREYAAKAELFGRGGKVDQLDLVKAELKGQFVPGQKGVLRADVPLWQKEVSDRLRANPEARGSFEDFNKHFQKNPLSVIPGAARSVHHELSSTVNFQDMLDPKYIRDSKHFQGHSLNELGQYARAKPLHFAAGLGLTAAGTAAAGYGASRLHELYKSRQPKQAADAAPEMDPRAASQELPLRALAPKGHQWLVEQRSLGRPDAMSVRGRGALGTLGGLVAGAVPGALMRDLRLAWLGSAVGSSMGAHLATRGLLEQKKEASLRGARAVLAALKVSDVKAADIDKLLSGSVLGATGSNGAAEAASDEDRLMRMFRDADAKVGPTGEENGMSLPQEGSLGLA